MSILRPKICIISASPLTVFFFLKPLLLKLSQQSDVTLICNFNSDSYLPNLDLPVRQISIDIQRRISLLSDIKSLISIYNFIKNENFQIVISVVPKAGLLGMISAFLVGVKIRLHIFQGEVWASKTGISRYLLKITDWITAYTATHLLAVSHSEKQFLEEQGIVTKGRLNVLGSGSICGVDISRFQKNLGYSAKMRKSLKIPYDAIVCLFLGRLTADKGVIDLVQAFTLCQDTNPRLWLLLVGPDEQNILQLSQPMLANIAIDRLRTVGFTSNPEHYLAAADFLCLPSHREGFGMVVIEAGAAGIPSIGSNIYGLRDSIVEGQTGLLVAPAQPNLLANAIGSLANDSNLRARLGSAALSRVLREFKQDDVVDRYVNYILSLIAQQVHP